MEPTALLLSEGKWLRCRDSHMGELSSWRCAHCANLIASVTEAKWASEAAPMAYLGTRNDEWVALAHAGRESRQARAHGEALCTLCKSHRECHRGKMATRTELDGNEGAVRDQIRCAGDS